MSKENKTISYRLPNGQLLFVFDTGWMRVPPWRIGTIKEGRRGKDIAVFEPMRHGKFKTE